MTQKKEPVFCELDYSASNLERNRGYGMVTRSGVVYDGELAGPNGMTFVLLREPGTTEQMLTLAVQELRSDRDVVGNIKVTAVIEPQIDSPRQRG